MLKKPATCPILSQIKPLHTLSLHYNIQFNINLQGIVLVSGFIPSRLNIKPCRYFTSHIRAKYSAHFIPLDFITIIMFTLFIVLNIHLLQNIH
jgi:hypothetical protein